MAMRWLGRMLHACVAAHSPALSEMMPAPEQRGDDNVFAASVIFIGLRIVIERRIIGTTHLHTTVGGVASREQEKKAKKGRWK